MGIRPTHNTWVCVSVLEAWKTPASSPFVLPLLLNWLMVVFVHDLFRSQNLFFICLQDLLNIYDFAVLPQTIQIVERTGFLCKDMDDHIAVIQQNPGIGTIALCVLGRNPMLLFSTEIPLHLPAPLRGYCLYQWQSRSSPPKPKYPGFQSA